MPTEQQLQKLWQSGQLLSQVWFSYAHPTHKARWNELKNKSALEAFTEAAKLAEPLETTPPEKVGQFWQNLFHPAQEILAARAECKKQMQTNIVRYLREGHILAYGFEPPRQLASIPVELPKGIWAGKFDWENDSISHAGLNFVQVRLTTAHIHNEILNQSNLAPAPHSPQRAGRPTVGPYIVEAFRALNESGQIDISASASSHYPKVRDWLSENRPNLPAAAQDLGREVIRRNFIGLFKALKNNHKL